MHAVRELTTSVTPLRLVGALLEVLDQRRLPATERWLAVRGVADAVRVIRTLAVRGAPAIGITAAYALALEARRPSGPGTLRRAAARLAAARPTAVNLAWATAEVLRVIEASPRAERAARALDAARAIHEADAAACRAIGEAGAALLEGPARRILTHCNAGALATGGVGTALGVVRALHAQGRLARLYADETRPVLQGARLTAWEALRDGIPVTVLADCAAASLLAAGEVDGVVVGADRIAADGSVANKIGTYPLAVLAARHGVPFVVAAPASTFDPDCPDGAAIPVELRGAGEVLSAAGRRLTPEGAEAYNPAFDVTPPELVTAIVSEHGVASPVTPDSVARVAGGPRRGGA